MILQDVLSHHSTFFIFLNASKQDINKMFNTNGFAPSLQRLKQLLGGGGCTFRSGSALPPQKIICYYHFCDFPYENSNIFEKYFMIILAGNRVFRIFGKIGPGSGIFFSLKPSRDQDGANKKRFIQILGVFDFQISIFE